MLMVEDRSEQAQSHREARAETDSLGRIDPERYYTPDRVAYWLEHWRELEQLAVPTAPAVRYDATISQRTDGRRPADPMKYVDIEADLRRAWASLGHLSIEFKAVETVISGLPLIEMAHVYRLHPDTVHDAYRRATVEMARRLGWRE